MWPLLLAAAISALWVDLGRIHAHHQADTLIPVLVSLYYWTPFYWEQDRFGMLVPLLAIPFSHPFVNLLVQSGLGIFAGLAALVLLARYAIRDAIWPLVAALAIAGLLLLVPVHAQAIYFFPLPYGVATALCVGGLLLATSSRDRWRRRWRLGLALMLVGVAHWVNVSAGRPVAALAVARGLTSTSRRLPADPGAPGAPPSGRRPGTELGLTLALLAVGLAIGLVLRQTLAGRYATALSVTPPDTWLEGWRRLLLDAWNNSGPLVPTVVAGLALASLALGLLPGTRRRVRTLLPAVLGLTGAALVYGGGVGTLGWVAENRFPWRYLLPSFLFLGLAVATWMVAPIAASRYARLHAMVHIGAFALVLVGAAGHTGVPALAEARHALDERHAQYTADLLAAGATHVAGHYWTVWPAVFHVNLTLYERGEHRVVWGLAWRSRPAWKRWRDMPPDQVRIAVAPGDPDAPFFLEGAGLAPLMVVDKRPTVWVLRPARGLRPGETVLGAYDGTPTP